MPHRNEKFWKKGPSNGELSTEAWTHGGRDSGEYRGLGETVLARMGKLDLRGSLGLKTLYFIECELGVGTGKQTGLP